MPVTALLTLAELSEFLDVYPIVLDHLNGLPDSKRIYSRRFEHWMKTLMDYNVPTGKFFRAQLALAANKHMRGNAENDQADERFLALAWAIEMIQSASLVADDIMDRSTMRRGRKCWHLVDNVGNDAINDILALENAAFWLLGKLYWNDSERYSQFAQVFHEAIFKCTYGQALDVQTEKSKNIESFTMELYEDIAVHKTAYYITFLPVALGMINAGAAEHVNSAKDILVELGMFFQIQDDVLDVYGTKEAIGKDGNDIANGKCAWPIIKAMEIANDRQKTELKQHYGQANTASVDKVLDIFGELNIWGIFKDYKAQVMGSILKQVEDLGDKFPNKDFLKAITKTIFQRSMGIDVKVHEGKFPGIRPDANKRTII